MSKAMVRYIIVVAVLALALGHVPHCLSSKTVGGGYLYPQFYDHSCPNAQEIVKNVVAKAVAKEPRMAASLLRLHFHDCFVKGCDASVLLDSSGSIISEKRSIPNRNSARGFEVIDEIKAALEKECPHTVSCADIVALAARDSTVLTGGPSWDVPLGRRDSTGASLSGSNNNIPAPNNTFQTILTKFKLKGLDIVDLVALSGKQIRYPVCAYDRYENAYGGDGLDANRVPDLMFFHAGSHTIGNARCTSFRQRLYNQSGNGRPDYTLDQSYASQLRANCPRSGGDQNLFFIDFVSPINFDNSYFKNLLVNKGLLNSDQVFVSMNGASRELVKKYAYNQELFFQQFAKSMIKMGNISPLTGNNGQIRNNCRKVDA